jgi:hypothetical protein
VLDLRYHIASIIAVFLALTVGIVIGISLGSSERQSRVVQRLQEQFVRVMREDHAVREENARLEKRLEAREEVVRQLAPLAIRDRLAGQHVALVLCGMGDRPEYLPALREMLSLAGAQVISTTRVPAPFGPVSPEVRARLAGAAATNGDTLSTEEGILSVLGEALAAGDGGRRLRDLADGTGVQLDGEYRLPAPRIVFLCFGTGAPEPPVPVRVGVRQIAAEPTVALMARSAATAGATVVVGEPEAMPPLRGIRGLAGRGISTVDNVDSAAGQVALVLALAGARGNFGVGKSTGARAMPPLGAAP